MTQKIDWVHLRLSFITDPQRPTVREFAGKHKLPSKTVSNRASEGKWLEFRDNHWETVTAKAAPILEGLQAITLANDTASRLAEIRGMANHAFRAIIPKIGTGLGFEKAGDAIQAYERLIKLERLLTDQSTEIISVRDARQMVDDILTCAEEVFGDDPRLQTFGERLAGLRPAQSANQSPMEATLN